MLSLLLISLSCTPLFAGFGVASMVAAYWNLDGSFAHPTRDATVAGVFWSCFSLFSAALAVYCYRYRLYISDSKIRQVGPFLTTEIDLSNVTKVRWRFVWRDVVLWAGRSRLRVKFEDFSGSDFREIVAFLRHRFDPDIQQGWSLFSKHVLARSTRKSEPMSWRRLSLGIFLACLGTFGWFFVFVWFVGGERQNFAIGVFLAILLLICLSLPVTWRELRRTKASECRR